MNLFSAGWLWYHFNVLVIAGIIFYLLEIMRQRAKRIIINTAETPYKQDNTMFKKILLFCAFGLAYFGAREANLDEPLIWMWDKFISAIVFAWNWFQTFLGSWVNG